MLGLVVSPITVGAVETALVAIYIKRTLPLLYVRNISRILVQRVPKEERKRREKLVKKKGLKFGDWISFERKDVKNRIIEEYERMQPVTESRTEGEFLQIQDECVFRHRTGESYQCFSTFFGYISVTDEVASRFLMDVSYLSWVSLEYKSTPETLEFSFGGYVSLPDHQETARLAPWNTNNPLFVVRGDMLHYDDDDDSCNARIEVFDSEGIVTGIRSVFAKQSNGHRVLFAYLDPKCPVSPGVFVRFKASYNYYLKFFAISSYSIVRKKEKIPTKELMFGQIYLLAVKVCFSPDISFGYVKEIEHGFGIIGDPERMLAPLLIDASKERFFTVYVEDTGEGSFCRFTIKDLPKVTKIQVENATSKEMLVANCQGFYLGNGSVYVAKRSMFDFRFSELEQRTKEVEALAVGTYIIFEAQATVVEGVYIYIIKQWKKINISKLTPLNVLSIGTEFLFEARCHYLKEMNIYMSEEFGYLDDPNGVLSNADKREHEIKVFWVGYNIPRSRTPFAIKSVDPPKPCVFDGFTGNLERFSKLAHRNTDIKLEVTVNNEDGSVQDNTNGVDKNKIPSEDQCTLSNCIGRKLLRRILNDRRLLRLLRQAGKQDLVVRMISTISDS